MKEIVKTFNNSEIRMTVIDNEPYFCGLDVGKALELKDVQRQINRLPEKGTTKSPTLTSGGEQYLLYVNEANLYRLIFKSKKLEAIKFQDWIFDEVIPSIKKTGKYSISEKLKIKSTKARNSMTAEWKKHKVEKPAEYRELTLQEYKSLNFEEWKRKKDFTEDELKLLTALELMEQLKLTNIPDIEGFLDCKESIKDTAGSIKQIVNNKEVE